MDQMTDLEMDQQRHGYFHSEPFILRSGNFSQPNIHTVVTSSGNTANIDSHYLPDAYDNAMMYGVTQYNGIQHQHNLDMGIAAAPNLYYSVMNPSSSIGVLPVPLNHRSSDQLPDSSTFTVSGVSSDNYGRGSGFIDDVRGPYKRKHAEGIRGNFQYFNPSASSSVPPPNARHPDGVAIMDAASFALPQFPVGPHGSAWSRPSEAVMVHEHNHMLRGNYLGQHFHQVSPPWLDQQLNSNNGDGYTAAWNPSLPMPYMQAPNLNGSSLENATVGLQRYQDTASSRSGLGFPPPPPNHQHHNYHHPTLPMPGVRGHNINFHPPVTATSYRVPPNPSRSTLIPAQNGFEMATRHVGPSPSAGLPVFRPHRGALPETTLGHRNLHRLSILHVDDIAILDMQEFYELEREYIDHHREMRLDIEDMSYEELLALGERIGNVSTGLTEEIITRHLKTKTFVTSEKVINLEEAPYEDEETDSCIICQDEYKNKEKIGILKCGHEYHEICLKKWLLVKNVCPICKSEALTPRRRGV